MRRLVPLFAVVLFACADDPIQTAFTAPVFDAGFAGTNYVTPLSGSEEIPPRTTEATGVAQFRLSRDGLSMTYHLNVENISNVTASHIHIGPPTANGPVGVFLAGPFPAGGGPIEGKIGSGTFTAANFVGPLAGMSMADLIALIEAGQAYVNVHTNDGIAPTNTGPGDFPGGEIRGHIDSGSGFHP